MPIKATNTTVSGETETIECTTLSDAAERFTSGDLADCIVFVLSDTGKARFNGSHKYTAKSGKDKGTEKDSKAVFVIAELGDSFAGHTIDWSQGEGPAKGLPLTVKMSILATPPNRDGKTIAEALTPKSNEIDAGLAIALGELGEALNAN